MEQYSKKLETIIAIQLVCLLLFFFVHEKWLLVVSFSLSLFCLLSRVFLNVIHKIWSSFFSFIGAVNSKILLSLVFILVLVPVAFLKKAFNKNPACDKNAENNYTIRNHTYTANDLTKMG